MSAGIAGTRSPARVRKKSKNGDRFYTYYRCTYYNKAGHPRVRVTEADIDRQVLALFDKMQVEDENVRDWFRLVLASQTRDAQAESMAQRSELQRQETLLVQQQDRLLNMRLSDDIDQETFARKHRNCGTGLRRLSCSSTRSTGRTMKPRNWPRKLLNFRKRFGSSGLPQTM